MNKSQLPGTAFALLKQKNPKSDPNKWCVIYPFNEKSNKGMKMSAFGHNLRSSDDPKLEDALARNPSRPVPKIIKIAVGGGKGGVGKTLFSLLFGIFLALNEKKVILIDTDFAGPDLNRLLGIPQPEKTLNRFFLKQVAHVKNLFVGTPLESLDCIFSAHCPHLISNFREMKQQFYSQLIELDKEIIIFDLSSAQFGASVELFLDADYPVLVTNNELTSIRQSFAFLKTCIIHMINSACTISDSVQNELEQCRQANPKKFLKCLKQTLLQIQRQNQECYEKIVKKFSTFRPCFLFNMAHDNQLAKEQMALQLVVEESLGIELKYLGTLEFMAELRKIFRSPDIFKELSSLTIKYANLKMIADKLMQKSTQNTSLIHFKNVLRQSFPRFNLLVNEESNNQIICSNKCPYWEKCQMRRGGHVCRVEYIGFLCHK